MNHEHPRPQAHSRTSLGGQENAEEYREICPARASGDLVELAGLEQPLPRPVELGQAGHDHRSDGHIDADAEGVGPADDLEQTNARAAPGVHDAFTTGPLPGANRLMPAPSVLAEEQQWAAATGMDWSWFAKGGSLEAPGERRPLLMRFRGPPTVTPSDGTDTTAGESITWVEFVLPSGGYATEVLNQVGVNIPADRRG